MYRFLCRHNILFFWDKCLGMLLLSCMVTIFLIYEEIVKLISRVAIPFHVPTSIVGEIHFLHLFVSIWCCDTFIFGSDR